MNRVKPADKPARRRLYALARPGSAVSPVPFSAKAYRRGLRPQARPEAGFAAIAEAGRESGLEPERDSAPGVTARNRDKKFFSQARIVRQVSGVPAYWVRLDRAGPAEVAATPELPEVTRQNLRLLVLEARKIPHKLVRHERRRFRSPDRGEFFPASDIYVPALHAPGAMSEILAFEAERADKPYTAPHRANALPVLLFFCLLGLWHFFRWYVFVPGQDGFWAFLPPRPEDWSAAFGLDAYRFSVLHEYWRALTALTLHADDAHMLSNAAFGFFLFSALSGRAGPGLGLVLGLVGGVLGNMANGFFRPAGALSVGFSTSVFAAVGALCLLVCADVLRFGLAARAKGGKRSLPEAVMPYLRPSLAPLAAGLALLGLLGGGGDVKTDYAAHVWGFAGGMLCAVLALPALRRLDSLPPHAYNSVQTLLYALALVLPAAPWLWKR